LGSFVLEVSAADKQADKRQTNRRIRNVLHIITHSDLDWRGYNMTV